MQRETSIQGVPFKVDGDWIVLGDDQNTRVKAFNRSNAKQIIAFIQQWLDHDPEQELREILTEIRQANPCTLDNDDIIAAVREHDARYGRPE